ncbi:MAG: molybdopterin molybdotransferase MoeA [Erysipelotrichaceae bacterium]|nr:molybdopterin molybdotransferase MoeA [Erysipelotrichaceae bacterium]MDY5251165.1 molybdopterin molybdotransferase MoeA [Erysipelotrichaceae bacterium]
MNFITIEEAWQLISSNIKQKKRITKVNIQEACGMIIAKNYYSSMANPPFDRSPLDGYACRSQDMTSLQPLVIIDKIYAGMASSKVVNEGECVNLMTGAPIPQGADCVIKQEDVEVKDGKIYYQKALKHLQNIVFKGEDIQENDLIIAADTKISKLHTCVLASVGISEVEVYDNLRASIITTGDEVMQPYETLSTAKIYDSTSTYIATSLRQCGITKIDHYCVKDESDNLLQKLAAACKQCDLVITTGGVSVGEKDLLEDTLRMMGAKILFHGVKMKPGSPVMVATLNDSVIVALSGNPFAALATFELICRPCMHALDPAIANIKTVKAIMANDYDKVRNHVAYVRGHCANGMVTIPSANHSSGSIRSMIGCNCLVEILADQTLTKAKEVKVVMLEEY